MARARIFPTGGTQAKQLIKSCHMDRDAEFHYSDKGTAPPEGGLVRRGTACPPSPPPSSAAVITTSTAWLEHADVLSWDEKLRLLSLQAQHVPGSSV